MTLSLGFSPCPNDTFIFYGLVHGLIGLEETCFQEPVLEDVEQLNRMAKAGVLDVTKLSFHALGHVLDDYCLLRAGSALGRGCGPLLIGREMVSPEKLCGKTIGIPGSFTTAALLLRMFAPQCDKFVEMRFDQIPGAVVKGEIDCGLIIHESRFTYQELGLLCIQDLGEWWETLTGHPIPLGCIAAKRSLGAERIAAIDRAIRKSCEYGFGHSDDCLPYIWKHSQELSREVVQSHIGLYVNDFTLDLGREGIEAVEEFMRRGKASGALPPSDTSLTV